jgi:UrcA family protein
MKRSFIAGIVPATAIAFAVASPASARTAADEYEVRISYADLNLQSESGADALLRRVRNEARDVCGDHAGRMSLRERRAIRVCISDFEERAVAALGNEYITTRFAHDETSPFIMASR